MLRQNRTNKLPPSHPQNINRFPRSNHPPPKQVHPHPPRIHNHQLTAIHKLKHHRHYSILRDCQRPFNVLGNIVKALEKKKIRNGFMMVRLHVETEEKKGEDSWIVNEGEKKGNRLSKNMSTAVIKEEDWADKMTME